MLCMGNWQMMRGSSIKISRKTWFLPYTTYSIYLDNTNIMSIHKNMFRLTGNDTRCPLPDTDLSQGHLLPELCPSTAGIPTVILLGEGGGWLSKLWLRMTWERGWVVWPNMIYDYDRGGWWVNPSMINSLTLCFMNWILMIVTLITSTKLTFR